MCVCVNACVCVCVCVCVSVDLETRRRGGSPLFITLLDFSSRDLFGLKKRDWERGIFL